MQTKINLLSRMGSNNTLRSFLGSAFILFSLIAASFLITPRTVLADNLLASISSGELTALVNIERSNQGLPALAQNALLQKAAELKVNDMIKRGYFSHNTPDGQLPWYWLGLAGYKYQLAGENLAVRVLSSREAVQAWMNSPGHRENILKKGYTEVGTAVAQGVFEGQETVFAVQFFGTPVKTSEAASPVKIVAAKAAIPTKKAILLKKKKVTISKNSKVASAEIKEMAQYPRMYYTFDNGVECKIG
jgi:hypothetical protein